MRIVIEKGKSGQWYGTCKNIDGLYRGPVDRRTNVADIAIRWPIKNGLPFERLWTITFTATMESRANEKPIFVHCYRAQP
jgi:hypothetical protein